MGDANPYESPRTDQSESVRVSRPTPSWPAIWLGLAISPLAFPIVFVLLINILILNFQDLDPGPSLEDGLFLCGISYIFAVVVVLPTAWLMRRANVLTPIWILGLSSFLWLAIFLSFFVLLDMANAPNAPEKRVAFAVLSVWYVSIDSPAIAFAAWIWWHVRPPADQLSSDHQSQP